MKGRVFGWIRRWSRPTSTIRRTSKLIGRWRACPGPIHEEDQAHRRPSREQACGSQPQLRALDIARAARAKGKPHRERLTRAYCQLLNATSRIVGQAKRFSREIAQGVKRAKTVTGQLALEALRQEIDGMVPLVRQVMKQTRALALLVGALTLGACAACPPGTHPGPWGRRCFADYPPPPYYGPPPGYPPASYAPPPGPPPQRPPPS